MLYVTDVYFRDRTKRIFVILDLNVSHLSTMLFWVIIDVVLKAPTIQTITFLCRQLFTSSCVVTILDQ